MSYASWRTTIISLLSITLLLKTTIADDDNPYLYSIWTSSPGNFMSLDTDYLNGLSDLLSSLQYKTPSSGFGQASTDQAYGLALCRGDVTCSVCQACVANASSEIVKQYHNARDEVIVIWYNYCMLKYMNRDFFGQIDNQNKFYMYNEQNITNPKLFNEKVKELLSQLSHEASMNPKFYGSGGMKLDTTTNLYGLAQCTRDLSSKDCKSCLDEAISELPSCCDGKQGGRTVGGSCNVRYEIYPFVNS